MATDGGFRVPEIDWRVHCVQLSTAVEALLARSDDRETRMLARMMLDEYGTAVARANAVPRPDNVVFLRPFSLATAIDDITKGGASS